MTAHHFTDQYEVDGEAIKRFRNERGMRSAEALAEAAGISPNTVYRALRGNYVNRISLDAIAVALNVSFDAIIKNSDFETKYSSPIDVSGKWTGFFIETFVDNNPYVVETETIWSQIGNSVTGRDISKLSSGSRIEEYDDFRLYDGVLIGTMQVFGLERPAGTVSIQLKISTNGQRADGYAVWYGSDSEVICSSRCMYIRNGVSEYSRLRKHAERIMNNEVALYKLRKIAENTDSFSQALRLLDHTLNPDRYDFINDAEHAKDSGRNTDTRRLSVQSQHFVSKNFSDYEHFLKKLVALDYETLGYVDPVLEGTVDQWAEIFEAYPDYWRVLAAGNEVVGDWHFLPLRAEIAKRARDGRLLDSELCLDDIDPLNSPGLYSIYIVSFMIKSKYRKIGFKLLLDSLLSELENISARGCTVEQVIIVALTTVARDLCEHMGMSMVGYHQFTANQTPVYAAPLSTILQNINVKTPALLERMYLKR